MTRVVDMPEEAGIFTVASPWTDGAGTLTEDTTTVPTGFTKSASYTPSGTWSHYRARTASGSTTVAYYRVLVAKHQNPSGNRIKYVMAQTAAGGGEPDLRLTTAGVLQASYGGGDAQNGPTLTNDVFVWVAWELDVSANPWRIKWRTSTDGSSWTDRTDATTAAAATTILYHNVYAPDDGPNAGQFWVAGTIIGEGTGHYGVDDGDAPAAAPGGSPGPAFIGGGFF